MAKRGQNEGSIYQREDSRWVGSINLGIINGKRRRKDFYGSTRKEVQEKVTAALHSLQQGIPVAREKQSVQDYLARWLTDVVRRKNRPLTFESYSMMVRNHITPAIGSIQLAKLTTQHVRSLLNQKQDEGLSTRTVQYMHAILRKALNVAMNDELIVRNVATLVEAPRVITTEVRPLTPAEARQFLEFIQGDRLQGFFTVAVSLGLRQGEALALRREDIDLEDGKLRVSYALQRRKGEIHLVEPKTERSRRTIDLPNLTVTALVRHIAKQDEERRLCGSRWITPLVHKEGKTETTEFLFTTTIGTPLESRRVTKRFQRILELAGIPRHRFHDLRHTAATLLAVQGVHPKAIQSALGWDEASMVDRYSHFVDEMRKDVAEKMDAILRPVAVNLAVKSSAPKLN